MNLRTILGFAGAAVASVYSTYAASVGVSFVGRNSSVSTLDPSEMAGVVPQANWNNVAESVYVPNFKGTTGPLLDDGGNPTAVTLNFNANDSWESDGTGTTPDEKLMLGIIKTGNNRTNVATFTFANLSTGPYDVYVYTDVNGGENGTNIPVNVKLGSKTYYYQEQHQFSPADTYTQASSTDPANPDAGNYCQFAGAVPVSGALTITVGWSTNALGNGDGGGIAALQLVGTFGSGTLPTIALTSQPQDTTVLEGTGARFTAGVTNGPFNYQWYKNGAPIAGAAGAVDTYPSATISYSTPPTTLGDSGATYSVVVSNSASGPFTSNSGKLTVVPVVESPGFVKVEFWSGLARTDVEDPGFTTPPDRVFYEPLWEHPGLNADNYVTRLSAIFIPPVTGKYTFYCASDDDSDLFISTDSTSANKYLIASEPRWNGNRAWTTTNNRTAGSLENTSDTLNSSGIGLVGGQRYYMEQVHHEGGGGDNASATFTMFGAPITDGTPSYLAGDFVRTLLDGRGATLQITEQPTNTSTLEGSGATFHVRATGTSSAITNIVYQWKKDGVSIIGGNGANYTTPPLLLADSGSKYRCLVIVAGTNVLSSEATVAVSQDTTPPTIANVSGSASFNSITVAYSEPVLPSTATNTANYQLNNGLTIVPNSAKMAGPNRVILATSQQTPGTSYTITINGVKDAAFTPNTIAPNSQFTFSAFVLSKGYLKFEWFDNIGGTTVAALTNAAGYLADAPDGTFYETPFNSRSVFPDDSHNNYGARISGFIVPAVSGNYTFFLSSDDSSTLYVSTNATPPDLSGDETTNPELVAYEPGCCNAFREPLQADGTPNPQTSQTPVALTANQQYALTLLMKEGGGGDFSMVAWRREGDTTPAANLQPISSGFLQTYADPGAYTVTITQQPADVTTGANTKATFTVAATVNPAIPLGYQWQKNNVDLAGANSASYTTPFLTSADNATYRCLVRAPGKEVPSANATLTVSADSIPPTLSYAFSTDTTKIVAVFSEPVQPSAGNFTLDQGVTVSSAATDPNDSSTLNLTTSAMTPGTLYNLTATGVKDLANNVLSPNPTIKAVLSQIYDPATAQQALKVLQTAGMKPLGSLTVRGFTGRIAHVPGGPTDNLNARAEAELNSNGSSWTWNGTTYGASDIVPENYTWTGVINFDNDGGTPGRIQGDTQFPNVTVGGLDSVAMDITTYLELRIGIYRLGINSDDGFGAYESPSLIPADPQAQALGVVDLGRGAADTQPGSIFDFLVTQDGLYPFRIIWEEGTGGMNIEWWQKTLDCADATDVTCYTLINDTANNPAAIKAFQPPGVVAGPTISVTRTGNTLNVSWAPTGGHLESAPALLGTSTVWSPAGSANPTQITIPGSGNLFIRVASP